MRLLLINPNTSEFVTERAVSAARAVSTSDIDVEGVTGTFGAPIINSETDMVVGAHSTVHLAAKHAIGFDAVGLAVSFDTGLAALREMLSIPVAGMAESSIRVAREHGERIALVSFGQRTRAIYERLALQYLQRKHFGGVRCMDALTDDELNDPVFLRDKIAMEVEQTVREFNCDAIVLLATAFAGLSAGVSHEVPVIDGVGAMIRELEDAAKDGELARKLTDQARPQRKLMRGVSEELENFYQAMPPE